MENRGATALNHGLPWRPPEASSAQIRVPSSACAIVPPMTASSSTTRGMRRRPMTPPLPRSRSNQFRQRAIEARRQAAHAYDPALRCMFEDNASNWEGLAEQTEWIDAAAGNREVKKRSSARLRHRIKKR